VQFVLVLQTLAISGRRLRPPCLAGHHDHRTAGVLHAVGTLWTHQHAREAPVTMATDDEQVGVDC